MMVEEKLRRALTPFLKLKVYDNLSSKVETKIANTDYRDGFAISGTFSAQGNEIPL